MRPELSILSFLCIVLLTGLAPLHIRARNVASVAIIMWLLLCNIIQGVNSIVWSGNNGVHAPVWCDISTKILLGAHISLPAASTCICIHLYTLSADRDPTQRPHRRLFEFILCVLIPLVYMATHPFVQNHRFDIAEDFGCVPSLYISAPVIVLIWIPPAILCIVTFCFSALAVWNHTYRNPIITDRAGLSPQTVTLTFLRPLLMATVICMVSFSVSIFDLYVRLSASEGLLPWISLAYVHAELAQIHIIDQSDLLNMSRIEAAWWLIPTSSIVFAAMAFIGLACFVQHDLYSRRSFGKWFRSTIFHRPSSEDTFIQPSPGLASRITLQAPTPPLPIHLKSGWDDSLKARRAERRPTLSCVIPLPSSSVVSDSESDNSFKASTLTYLESPTGREASGFPLPSISSALTAHKPSIPPPAWLTMSQLHQPAELSVSPAHSILTSPWPMPPSTVPSTPTKASIGSPHTLTPRSSQPHLRSPSELSLTTSLTSSNISASPYISDPDLYLHSVSTFPHHPPFQDAGMPIASGSASRHIRRARSKEFLSPKALSSSVKRIAGKQRDFDGPGEVIYMTVVHETQAC